MIPKHMKFVYDRYIASQEWKDKRERSLKFAYSKGKYWCQDCGWDFPKDQLEVHHLTYDRLGKERDSDLLVVCSRCHEKQDKIRAKKGRQRSESALDDARLDGWASKTFGEDWAGYHDEDYVTEKFEDWLRRKGED